MYEEMIELFEASNLSFLREQKELIESNVSERTLCGQLMLYINNFKNDSDYSSYYVDVEYNRNYGGRIKTIKNEEEEIITINCDLILHSRGENLEQDNLIALEMKKSTGKKQQKDKDRERLKALTRQSFDNIWTKNGTELPEHICRYVLGVYYEINISRMEVELEYYRNGALLHTYTVNIE